MKKNLRILLVHKRTRWERDLIRYGSKYTVKKLYYEQNNAYERIYQSHQRQTETLEKLRECLKTARFILQDELPFIDRKDFDLLISCGGDNHFVYVSYFANEIPILGLNSDPLSSTGSLLYFEPTQFIQAIMPYRKGNDNDGLSGELLNRYTLEKWMRIEGLLELPKPRKKVKIGPCISEISIRNSFHDYISRFLVHRNTEDWEEIKCSGYLLANGAGSTGWYRNAHFDNENASFAKDMPFFYALARETNYSQRSHLRYLNPKIETNDKLTLISAMDGEITLDANPEQVLPFPHGARATFFLSKQKLNVVKEIK